MISSLFCCLSLLHCGVKKDPIAQNYQAGPLSALESPPSDTTNQQPETEKEETQKTAQEKDTEESQQ